MLYNNWQVHEGRSSLFGGAPANTPVAADKAVAANKVDVPTQISGLPVVATTPVVSGGAIEGAEKFILQNDVLVLEISASGANVIDAKLLKSLTAENKPVELFQYTPTHKYFARSGLISIGSNDLPNHTSTFKLAQSGKDESGRPFAVFVSERNGVKLEKTFILNPGSYVVDVGHRVTQSSSNPNPLVLYTEIVRDGSQEQKLDPLTAPFLLAPLLALLSTLTKKNSISWSSWQLIKTKLPSLLK